MTAEQKEYRHPISSDLLNNAQIFDKAITGDVTRCLQNNMGAKRQKLQREVKNSHRLKIMHISLAVQNNICLSLILKELFTINYRKNKLSMKIFILKYSKFYENVFRGKYSVSTDR